MGDGVGRTAVIACARVLDVGGVFVSVGVVWAVSPA